MYWFGQCLFTAYWVLFMCVWSGMAFMFFDVSIQGLNGMVGILQKTFSNAFLWKKISQAINLIDADILSITPKGTNLGEIWVKMFFFSEESALKNLLAKYPPFVQSTFRWDIAPHTTIMCKPVQYYL